MLKRGLETACAGVIVWLAALVLSVTSATGQSITLRAGHFPNISHVQALVAHHLSRSGKGWFEERLGPDVKIEWFVYNAGPSAMEAIFRQLYRPDLCGSSPRSTPRQRRMARTSESVSGPPWRRGARHTAGSRRKSRRRFPRPTSQRLNSAIRRMCPRALGSRPAASRSRKPAATLLSCPPPIQMLLSLFEAEAA